jgi:hypothetical protein
MAETNMPPELAADLQQQCGVVTIASAVRWLGRAVVRWRLERGRWQQPCRGVVVTRSGPLSPDEMLWVVVLGAGTGAVLDAAAWWADMHRDNELTLSGYRVLRFPAFAVRDHPEEVAAQIADALGLAG